MFGGQPGSPVARPLCRLREVLLGAGPWVGRGEVLAGGRGRPEEVPGPELALCLTQGLVHPPPGPQLCLLSQSLRCRDASLLPALLFSNHPHTHPPRPRLRLPAAPGDQEEPVSEPRVGPHALVVEFILVAGNWMYFPCIHIGGGPALLLFYPCIFGLLVGGPPAFWTEC